MEFVDSEKRPAHSLLEPFIVAIGALSEENQGLRRQIPQFIPKNIPLVRKI
jgi:hypothetical protein